MTRSTMGRVAGMIGGALSVMATVAGMPAIAHAQDPGPAPVGVPPVVEAPAVQPHPTEAPLPAVAPAATVVPPRADSESARDRSSTSQGTSDLDVEARPFAIGYAGLSEVPVGLGVTGGPAGITVPALGLRYWLSPKMGLDLSLGIGWTGGSSEQAGMSTDKDGVYGFIVHGGIPFALSTHRHTSFQVIPFAAVAHGWTSTSSSTVLATTKTDSSGTRVDVGVRAGFEVFLGFIGIPELALSATVGVQFEMRKYSVESDLQKQADTTFGISTTVQNNPWDIFAGTVAARYYL